MKRVVISLILLVALNASARDVIDLRCTYQANGKTSEQTFFYDENGIEIHSTQEKNSADISKGIDYLKITVDKDGYLKIESESFIFSTNGAESKFLTWSTNDLKIEVKNKSDENRFILVANMSSNKFGKLEIFESFEIDRVSGYYKKIEETKSTIGNAQIGLRYSLRNNYSYYSIIGFCEKFSRKF